MQSKIQMNEALAHLVGDYLLQTHNEAVQKTSRSLPAATHAIKYAAAFLPVTRNWKALAVIGGTHYVIDRYSLAKYVVWLKNGAKGPVTATGYPQEVPDWLSTWLMIAADNTIHMLINRWAVRTFDE